MCCTNMAAYYYISGTCRRNDFDSPRMTLIQLQRPRTCSQVPAHTQCTRVQNQVHLLHVLCVCVYIPYCVCIHVA